MAENTGCSEVCSAITITVIFLILIRTLRKDIAKYNRIDDVEDIIEESGWKLVHGDVFRPPRHTQLFTALFGSGVQLFFMVFIVIFFAMLGTLSPASRGALMNAAIFIYVFMGLFAGYFAGRLYKTLHGPFWKSTAVATGLLFPSIVLVFGLVINTFIWYKGSSAAIPFTTLLALLSLWLGISLPLIYIGFFFGYRKRGFEQPIHTNRIPRAVPDQRVCQNLLLSTLYSGALPFGAVFIEVFFIYNAIWESQFYYLFGFLFIVFIILIICCAQVAIVAAYFQLCNEDYHWWWRTFITSGGAAVYLLGYSFFYFLTKCLKTYVISVLRDRIDVNCACPSYLCSQGGQLTDSEIKDLLPPDIYQRFSAKKLQREIERNVNVTFCPAINCGAVCQIPSLKASLPNGMNPPSKSSGHFLERFTRWYRRRLCNSQEVTHFSPSAKDTNFLADDTLRISNSTCYQSVGDFVNENKERVATPTTERVEQKNLHLDKRALIYQVSPGRPAVRVVCNQCSHEFCARCHLNWHIGVGPYVCEEYTRNGVKGNKNLSMQYYSQQNLLGNFDECMINENTSNHINAHLESDPIVFDQHKSHPVTQNSELMKSLTSLKNPKKNKMRKVSFRRSKRKRRGYLQNHSAIHLSNPDISDNVDVSVLAVGFPPYSPDDWLKRCPACLVPIERIEGCAQMMCRSCKHTFCWYCLTSLDDDFLLQHYDDGACKGKLGHSRASVIGHRVYRNVFRSADVGSLFCSFDICAVTRIYKLLYTIGFNKSNFNC
ncbi:hypothetical protein MN116_002168 [Schistosoma mekongi]|uniref:Transmembrane 9 superfamily member n=1 Tax=Schistosoma mekongi TaxID=38744 RepID=A0AAE2D9H2_SCHME|nr:hypothetical protein MN116_002168 [Schistosoma mekongi]